MKQQLARSVSSLAGSFLAVLLLTGAAPTNKLETVKGLPDGLAKGVAALLSEKGLRLVSGKGTVAEVWFAKQVAVKAGFKPTLNVKYPFQPGQFIGVLRVGKAQTFTDFRGQELKPGVYTLRYGQQPEDGNHIGTSETADFLLALPAKMDTDPKTISLMDTLFQRSAKAAGSTHPAIFYLLPPEKSAKTALMHDEDKEFWILQTALKAGKKAVPLRLVIVGKSEG